MKADKFDKLQKCRYRKQQNEKNDCSVKAIAIACRLTYKSAHITLAQLGRRNGRGTHNHIILGAARVSGFEVTEVKKVRQKNGSKFTPKTIGGKLKNGYYLAFVNGHVISVVNGVVHDWTAGRNHHINEVYKVTRKRA